MAPSSLRLFFALFVALHPMLAQDAASGSSIAITPNPPLPNAAVGTRYTVKFAAAGGSAPYTWSLEFGTLPAGLDLNGATGVIDGTPTSPGVSVFGLQATDVLSVAGSVIYTITVKPPAISTPSPLPAGPVRVSYTADLSATGGSPPYTWSAGPGLPAGIALDKTTGVLTGTPTTPGTSFAVHATELPGSRFTVQLDGGAANKPAPPWISVAPRTGATAARISVSIDSSSLRANDYSARVLVISADGSQTIVLPVTLSVDNRPPDLEVIPAYLRLTAPGQPKQPLETTLLIHNSGGGGVIDFKASVPDSTPWLTVEPASGSTSQNSHTVLRVIADPLRLRRDAYRGVIQITSNAGTSTCRSRFSSPRSARLSA